MHHFSLLQLGLFLLFGAGITWAQQYADFTLTSADFPPSEYSNVVSGVHNLLAFSVAGATS